MNELPDKFRNLEDFLLDDSFKKWVFTKDPSTGAAWKQWLVRYPAGKGMFNMAFHILENLYMKNKHISEEEVRKEIDKILLKIKEDPSYRDSGSRAKIFPLFRRYWKAVSAAIIIISAGIYYVIPFRSSVPATYAAFVKNAGPGTKEYVNKSDSNKAIVLADGSSVILYGNTRLVFTASAARREAFMEGKAFFEVTKNPARPFIVYTGKLVTKVLGTSFVINAYPASNQFTVVVKTGKVSVYREEEFTDPELQNNRLEGTLVTPNQQVVLEANNNNLVRTLVDEPAILVKAPETRLIFDAIPVSEVFTQLEREYGVHILYDEKIFNTCSLTATFKNESFYDKLDIIVKAVNASYSLVDGTVVLTSNGCK